MDPESIHGVGSLNDHGDFIPKPNEITDESIEKEFNGDDKTNDTLTVDLVLAELESSTKPPTESGQDDNDNVIKSLSSGESQTSSFEILGDSLDPTSDALAPTAVQEDAPEAKLIVESAEAEMVAISKESALSDSQTFDAVVDALTPQSSKPTSEAVCVDVVESVEAVGVDEDILEGDSEIDAFHKRLHKIESLDEIDLPSTVKRLKTKYGTRMFLIGTGNRDLPT